MFELATPYKPCGDQQPAIDALVLGIQAGVKSQVLLGVTGSGKTFTIANVIAAIQKPTLVVAHNKTLAAQLYQEFLSFFPHNTKTGHLTFPILSVTCCINCFLNPKIEIPLRAKFRACTAAFLRFEY